MLLICVVKDSGINKRIEIESCLEFCNNRCIFNKVGGDFVIDLVFYLGKGGGGLKRGG